MSQLKQCQDYFANQVFAKHPKPEAHLDAHSLKTLQSYPEYKQKIYRELVTTTITSMIEITFEQTLAYLGKDKTQILFEDFLETHKPRSHFYRQISQDFIDYCEKHQTLTDPVALDLFRYETACYHLRFAPNTKAVYQNQMHKDLLQCQMELNPDLIILDLSYPVHKTSDFKAIQKDPQIILVRRHNQTFEVETYQITKIAQKFIEHVKRNAETTLGQTLEQLINDFEHTPTEQVQAEATAFLKQALEEQFILTLC